MSDQRLIDANETKKLIRETFIGASDFAKDTREAACAAVDNAPTIEPPVVRWVSVEEAMPENAEPVLVFDCGYIYTCRYSNRKGIWLKKFHTITHWMPIPEPPKEDAHA